MPQCRVWTEEQDDVIRTMRWARSTWAQIGEALGLKRDTVIERGRRIRAVRAPLPVPAKDDDEVSGGEEREALPAGHPVSWGLLTAGTILEGTPWPRT